MKNCLLKRLFFPQLFNICHLYVRTTEKTLGSCQNVHVCVAIRHIGLHAQSAGQLKISQWHDICIWWVTQNSALGAGDGGGVSSFAGHRTTSYRLTTTTAGQKTCLSVSAILGSLMTVTAACIAHILQLMAHTKQATIQLRIWQPHTTVSLLHCWAQHVPWAMTSHDHIMDLLAVLVHGASLTFTEVGLPVMLMWASIAVCLPLCTNADMSIVQWPRVSLQIPLPSHQVWSSRGESSGQGYFTDELLLLQSDLRRAHYLHTNGQCKLWKEGL